MPFEKQEKKVKTTRDTYVNSMRNNYDMPELMMWNQLELKINLEDLCEAYNLGGDMEVDDGNSFSYTVIVHFPTVFGTQVVKTQFAPYDSLPTLQNPNQLGLDVQKVLDENQTKYGKSSFSSANTVLEVMDIEKIQAESGTKYINQIEKALFGEFNNAQRSFPRVRLKNTHWLPYVCFRPEISVEQQQQVALLNNHERNPTDDVLKHLIDLLNINDVTTTNLTLESLS